MIGLLVLVVGVVAAVVGNAKSHQRVKEAHGRVDKETARRSEGTGVVPASLSLVVLAGYVAIPVGIVLMIAGV